MQVSEVIERAGGVGRLAALLGMHHSSVCKWKKVGRIPTDRALAIHRLSGIPLHEMRPDVWPAPAPTRNSPWPPVPEPA